MEFFSIEMRSVLSFVVEIVLAGVILWRLRTWRRRAIAVSLLVLLLLAELVAFDFFVAPPSVSASDGHYASHELLGKDFGIAKYEAKSPWLGFVRTRVLVLYRGCGWVGYDTCERGFSVRLGEGPTAKIGAGRDRIFVLIGPSLQLSESRTPVFEELWKLERHDELIEHLHSLDRSRADEALRRFLDAPEKE